MSFAAELRDELAHVAGTRECCTHAELSALLRFGGVLRLEGGSDGGLGWLVTTGSGAVARRLRAALGTRFGIRPEVAVHRPGNLRRGSAYQVALQPPAAEPLEGLGILDDAGRPVPGLPAELVGKSCDTAAYLRGALMAAGTVSEPHLDTHLEVRAPGEAAAQGLAALIERVTGQRPGVGLHGGGWRVTLKSGAAIGRLLAGTGAHAAFLRWDQDRLRRELRGDANRVANADRANLRRSVAAASRQVEAVTRALASAEWEELPDELREVALARLANPEASLAELGGLLDPPVGKATVHRRLARLLALAEPEDA